MTIRVPLRLKRQAASGLASALYLPSRDPALLFAVCARIQLDPSGACFDLDGGFLVLLERPSDVAVPGTVRLKRLVAGLYLPADAHLVPALLADEAAGVVRDRGLVFLHGGQVLEFDQDAAIEPPELLEARTRRGRPWSSLPEPGGPAERLDQIVLDVPDPDPEEIYREIKKDMGRRKTRSGPEGASGGEGGGQAGLNQESEAGEEEAGPESGKNAGAGAGRADSLPRGPQGPGELRGAARAGTAGRGDLGDAGEDPVGVGRSFGVAQETGARVPGGGQGGCARASDPDHADLRGPGAGCRCGRTGCPGGGRCTTLPKSCGGLGEAR